MPAFLIYSILGTLGAGAIFGSVHSWAEGVKAGKDLAETDAVKLMGLGVALFAAAYLVKEIKE